MPRERPQGDCGLCRERRPLAVSHAIPKSLYRLCRAEGQPNPNPMVVTGKFRRLTSYQYQDHFLCDECEALFNTGGEQWTMAHCYRGRGRFLLRDSLLEATPSLTVEDTSVYLTAELPLINSAAVTYFAMSVFWRTAVRSWTVRGDTWEPIKLGPYAESIRLFLLGRDTFPAEHVAQRVCLVRSCSAAGISFSNELA